MDRKTPVSSLSGHATIYLRDDSSHGRNDGILHETAAACTRSTSRGAGLAKLGNLPSGAVSSIQINGKPAQFM